MGGRGSGGSRGGGGGSASKSTTVNEKNMAKAQNYLAKAYKYQDEYDDYSDFEKKMLSFDNGGGFIDSETAGGLFSYPRGICSIFLPYAAAGMRYDSKDRKLSFSPVVLPLRLSLSQFANFKDGIIPYIDFSIENGEVKTKVINEEALDGVSVYVYGKKEN